MTYTFKLARRLAVSRDFAMLAILALVAACAGDSATAPESADSAPVHAAPLSVLPSTVTAEINQSIRFRGSSRNPRADAITTAWSSTGGTITADGTFMSTTPGTFKVIGRGRGWKQSDTAVVIVVPPANDLARIVVSPGAVTLDTGATHTFIATASLTDGSIATVGVNWTASGGQVDAAGAFKAGSSAGNFRVIAANTAGTIADTSTITINAPAPPPAPQPPPPPAPTLASVYVTPASVSVSAGGTQQFKAYGRNSVGDSIPVTVTFATNSGTVSSSGLYTAGATAGAFRVVAKESSTGKADTSAVTVATAPVSTSTGIPFGPFGLWNSYTSVSWGPTPFTTSLNYTDAAGIVTQIASARAMKQKLVLSMTGGSHSNYLTNGKFDLAKWTARMDTYNTSAIKSAVAAGMADGTIIGNSIMDEPEHVSWGGVMTKPLLDQMGAYVKTMFPTLPVGVNHGPDGYYLWRPTERYRVVDYVLNQYNWWITKGDAVAWRDKVLAQGRLDGVALAFSLNILGGGIQSSDGSCPLATTGGLGPYKPTCRMTPTQVRDWGRTLGLAGCALFMWKFDGAFMANTDNVQAFRDVASTLAGAPGRSCRRP